MNFVPGGKGATIVPYGQNGQPLNQNPKGLQQFFTNDSSAAHTIATGGTGGLNHSVVN